MHDLESVERLRNILMGIFNSLGFNLPSADEVSVGECRPEDYEDD